MQRGCNGEHSQGRPSPLDCCTVVAALMRFVDKNISMLSTASIPILKNPFRGVRAVSEHGLEHARPDKKKHIFLWHVRCLTKSTKKQHRQQCHSAFFAPLTTLPTQFCILLFSRRMAGHVCSSPSRPFCLLAVWEVALHCWALFSAA